MIDISNSAHYVGDCRDLLAQLPDACVQTCITSPPYWGLRDYGHAGQLGLEATPELYVAAMVEVFRGVRRVLRDDGVLFLNLGDSYCGAPGGGQGATCERATRTFTAKTDFVKRAGGLKPKDLVGIPWLVAFALRADGWYLRQDIIWHKLNPMPESVRDRPTKAHEYMFLLSKSGSYYYDADAIREKADPATQRKTSAPNVTEATGTVGGTKRTDFEKNRHTVEFRNKRSVWTVASQPFTGAHFACFPPKLIEPCVLAGSRPGDIVLDPFFGSGTTGEVAEKHGRKWIGFDINDEYAKLAKERTAQRSLPGAAL